MSKEELIRDEDYTEEEAEKMVLQNKLDKANERIEELEDKNKSAIEFIKNKGNKFAEWENGFCIKATAEYTREEIFELLEILSDSL